MFKLRIATLAISRKCKLPALRRVTRRQIEWLEIDWQCQST